LFVKNLAHALVQKTGGPRFVFVVNCFFYNFLASIW